MFLFSAVQAFGFCRQIFIDRGHKVKTIALPPLPEGAPIPKEMDIEFGNFLELTDEELEKAMTGMDAFVYAKRC